VTTPAPGHGGTTLAWALTIAAAGRGENVLLVDANTHDPRLSEILSPPGTPKLDQALTGRIRPERLVIHDPDNRIRFLPLATEDLRNVQGEQVASLVHDAGLPCSMVWNAGARHFEAATRTDPHDNAFAHERRDFPPGDTMAEAAR